MDEIDDFFFMKIYFIKNHVLVIKKIRKVIIFNRQECFSV